MALHVSRRSIILMLVVANTLILGVFGGAPTVPPRNWDRVREWRMHESAEPSITILSVCSSSNGTILPEYANPDVLHYDENNDLDPCEDILHVCCLIRSEILQPDHYPTVTNKTEASGGSPDHPIVTPMPPINPCGDKGECVPYYQCVNGSIVMVDVELLDIRFETTSDGSTCENLFYTCCMERLAEPIVTPNPHPEKCGIRNIKGVVFEFKPHDNEAQFAEFPWAIALLHKGDNSSVIPEFYLCGGSLIHPSVVLTAAHCAMRRKADEFIVRAGDWDSQRTIEPFPHVDRDVSEILVHERFDKKNLSNDITLLFLVAPIEMAPNIGTVCLPPPDTSYDHQRSVVNGWGKDRFYGGSYSAIMKRIDVPVIPHNICEKLLHTAGLRLSFVLDASFMCAGGEPGTVTCSGDGGSPLVTKIDGTDSQYYQIGIVSWGISCVMETPSVYVAVSKFRNWIDDIFEKRNLDTSYYTPIL